MVVCVPERDHALAHSCAHTGSVMASQEPNRRLESTHAKANRESQACATLHTHCNRAADAHPGLDVLTCTISSSRAACTVRGHGPVFGRPGAFDGTERELKDVFRKRRRQVPPYDDTNVRVTIGGLIWPGEDGKPTCAEAVLPAKTCSTVIPIAEQP